MTDDPRYRLPRSASPRHYRLTLEPDIERATFSGRVVIDVDVHEPLRQFVLNAAELDIDGATVSGAPATVHLEAETERLVLGLDGELRPGAAVIEISFSGVLNDRLRGFYRSTYEDGSGTVHTIATTQFESTDARRCFPCWDEPDRKAVFEVTLVVPADLLAVSNSAIVAETIDDDGRRRVRFAPTMKMSTYLVAFVVGRMEATGAVDVDGTPLRVVYRPERAGLAEFALELGAHALRYFTDYFGIGYPGDKMDFLAIPDFASGAMENLGAVTYRESVLLVEPAVASHVELERVADVVCHEVAHMWFGDLVTMQWWDGIWLNEAFATFMELLAVDAFRPDWQRWVTFGTTRGHALATDGLETTRAIEFPVRAPAEAEAMFDPLTYQKGGGVLRMLEQYLGADTFRDGIVDYIGTHRYANAVTADLWAALERASGQPVGAVMDTWILQGGHPLVTVEPAGDTAVRLSQRQFRYRGEGTGIWEVPVLLRGPAGDHKALVGSEPVDVDLGVPFDWVVVNAGGWGTYRTRYAGGLLQRLLTDLGQLDSLERYTLVDDTWHSVLAGFTPLEDWFELVSALGDERDPNVWIAVIEAFETLHAIVTDEDRDTLEAFIRRVLGPAFERLGWEAALGESEPAGTARGHLLRALGTLGADPAVRDRAAGLHANYLADRTSVDPDLAGPLSVVVAWQGRVEDWDDFASRWRNPSDPQEEIRYLYALGQFHNPALVDKTLALLLSDVRTQNAPFLGKYLLENRVGARATWAWITEHWDEIVDRFPPKSLHRMIDGVRWLPPHTAAEAEDFLRAHPVPSEERTIAQALEKLSVTLAFGERERPRLRALLGSLS